MCHFFVMNQKRITWSAQSNSFWRDDSYESIIFSESKMHNSSVYSNQFLNEWPLWVSSFKWIKNMYNVTSVVQNNPERISLGVI